MSPSFFSNSNSNGSRLVSTHELLVNHKQAVQKFHEAIVSAGPSEALIPARANQSGESPSPKSAVVAA